MLTSGEMDDAVLEAEQGVVGLLVDYLRSFFEDRIPTVGEAVSMFGVTEEEAGAVIEELTG